MYRTGISPPIHDRTPRRRTAAYADPLHHVDIEARPRVGADFVWDYGSSFVFMLLNSLPNANTSCSSRSRLGLLPISIPLHKLHFEEIFQDLNLSSKFKYAWRNGVTAMYTTRPRCSCLKRTCLQIHCR